MQNIKIVRIILLVFSLVVLISLGYFFYNPQNSTQSNVIAHSVIHPDKENADNAIEVANQTNTDEHIISIIDKYIAENPEKIIASLESLDAKIKKEAIDRVNNKILSLKDQIEDIANFPLVGLPEAKKTIVMFYDYNCPYCQQANSVLNQFLSTEKDLRIIYRPFPIMGEFSEYLSKFIIAINQIAPDKFKAIHDELMNKGEIRPEDLLALMTKYNIDNEAFNNSVKGKAADLLAETQKLSQSIELRAAPAFIINDKFYKGVIHPDILKKILNPVEDNNIKTVAPENTSTPINTPTQQPKALEEVPLEQKQAE